jgi:iron-sulfur cluster assembly accessory protein
MSELVRLTEKASQMIREFLDQQDPADGFIGVRITVQGGCCSGFQYAMNLETAAWEGDEIVEEKGVKLFVDGDSSVHLQGTEIDYVETPEGEGFQFNNPNVRNSCGCGGSEA